MPSTLASGDYRVRFNITWNELDPCAELWAPQDGNATALNNRMDQVGGSMTDFIIRIQEADAIDEVEVENVKVYGAEGEIVIESKALATTHIYTANGVLFVSPFQSVGVKTMSVPAGMYMVKVDGVAQLVVVK